jgi:hypothetical protein
MQDEGMRAFPHPQYPDTSASKGMSLRDYFAAAALQGILAHYGERGALSTNTQAAWQIADAMLNARDNPTKS